VQITQLRVAKRNILLGIQYIGLDGRTLRLAVWKYPFEEFDCKVAEQAEAQKLIGRLPLLR